MADTKEKSMFARNWPIVVPIGVLVVILIVFMFAFIVEENEHVIVTRFGDPQLQKDTTPGLNWKWPYPIEEIWRHDRRIHVFPSTEKDNPTRAEFEEVYTSDKTNVIVSVSLTWCVLADESSTEMNKTIVKYMNNVGSVKEAEIRLNDLVRSSKTAVFGRHAYSELVNPDPKAVQIDAIEDELFQSVRDQANELYGIDVKTLSIAHLGLPEKTTGKVFQRMIAERRRAADVIIEQGKKEAAAIKARGDRKRMEIISKADEKAIGIRSEGDVAASEEYETFQKAPELAIFLRQLKALEALVQKRTFLYLDFTTPPLNLMSPEMLRQLQNNKLDVGTLKKSE